MVDRKKRKLGDTDSSVQSAAPAATPADPDQKAGAATVLVKANTAQPKAEPSPPKVSARASKKARKQKAGTRPAANPKQRLVRTVALGNLQPETKDEAVAMAQAAGKVCTANCWHA